MATTATPRRTRSPKGEGERLRDEILDAADSILKETGRADAVTMRAVAGRVGCTPGAIYLHFADRTELVTEVCRRLFDALDRDMERAAGDHDHPLAELAALGHAYVRFGLRHPEGYRIIFMGDPSLVSAHADVSEILSVGGFGRVVDAARRCMEAGCIASADPFAVATRLWIVVHGATSAMISKPWFPWGDVTAFVDRLLETQLDGLRPR